MSCLFYLIKLNLQDRNTRVKICQVINNAFSKNKPLLGPCIFYSFHVFVYTVLVCGTCIYPLIIATINITNVVHPYMWDISHDLIVSSDMGCVDGFFQFRGIYAFVLKLIQNDFDKFMELGLLADVVSMSIKGLYEIPVEKKVCTHFLIRLT